MIPILSCFLIPTFAKIVSASHPTTDIYYHEKPMLGPAMWTFGPQGIVVHSVDGGSVLHRLPQSAFCPAHTDRMTGLETTDCSFFDVASDGRRHVWAAVTSGTSRVEAFDIDSGALVAAVPTCSTPLDLDYHPAREEMWLHCAGETPGHEGHVDIFSTNSLAMDYTPVHLNETGRVYGRSVFHSSLGNFGYASVYKVPYLYKIDLSTREVVEKFPIPLSTGSYDMAYSPVNKHIYLRARVCCTCGTPEADVESCGYSGPSIVDVVTGPNKGFSGNGTCSNACEGSPADIGVWEFDTVSSTFLGSHNIDPKFGFGADPVASPDGKYIALLGNDGGQNVRILEPGANGKLSSVAFDVPVKFQGGGDREVVITDVVFIDNGVHGKVALFASSRDNDLAVVDLAGGSPRIHKLALTPASESTGGRDRKIEWAPDTNFVWVSGTEAEEMYVVELSGDGDVARAKVSATLTGLPSSQVLFVENYERKRTAEMMKAQYSQAGYYAAQGNGGYGSLAVASLVLSIMSLLVSLFLLAKLHRTPNGTIKSDAAAKGHPDDMKSLGSKIAS